MILSLENISSKMQNQPEFRIHLEPQSIFLGMMKAKKHLTETFIIKMNLLILRITFFFWLE